jgi:hypothetical protein
MVPLHQYTTAKKEKKKNLQLSRLRGYKRQSAAAYRMSDTNFAGMLLITDCPA